MSKTFCNTGMTIEELEGALMTLLRPYDPAQWRVIMKAFRAGVAVGRGDVDGEEVLTERAADLKGEMDEYVGREKSAPILSRASGYFKSQLKKAGLSVYDMAILVEDELEMHGWPNRRGGDESTRQLAGQIEEKIRIVCNGSLTKDKFIAWFEKCILNP